MAPCSVTITMHNASVDDQHQTWVIQVGPLLLAWSADKNDVDPSLSDVRCPMLGHACPRGRA